MYQYPPPDEPHHAQIDLCRKERHPPHPHSKGACDNVLGCETDGRSRFTDDGVDEGHNIGAVNRDPLVFVAHDIEMICASGGVASKICDAVLPVDRLGGRLF